MSAQLRALKDYAKANGYSVAREYVDEAESGRVALRLGLVAAALFVMLVISILVAWRRLT